MILSTLLIDTGLNPDRPRPGRLWLRNLYRVHQRLCMAFPSAPRKADDPDFLAPYRAGDFPEQRYLADRSIREVDEEILKDVHAPRDADRGFLFRIDPQSGDGVAILVQSAKKPDWEYAFQNARYLLAAKPEWREIDPCFTPGQYLRFRLVANPTRRLSRNSLGSDGHPIAERCIGKRVPVPNARLFTWLARQAEQAGFAVDEGSTIVQPGYSYFKKPEKWRENESADERQDQGKEQKSRLRSVLYEGILEVTDAIVFRQTVARGIGPGKAFGFGLLSVASAQLPDSAGNP